MLFLNSSIFQRLVAQAYLKVFCKQRASQMFTLALKWCQKFQIKSDISQFSPNKWGLRENFITLVDDRSNWELNKNRSCKFKALNSTHFWLYNHTIGHFTLILKQFSGAHKVKKVKKILKRLKKPKRTKKGKKGFRKVQKYHKTVKKGTKFVQWRRKNEPNLCKMTHCEPFTYLQNFNFEKDYWKSRSLIRKMRADYHIK